MRKATIDFAAPPRIGGWIHASEEEDVCLIVRRQGVVINKGSPQYVRADFRDGSKRGFSMGVDGFNSLSDLVNGKFDVRASVNGVEQGIDIWEPIRVAAMLDALSPADRGAFIRTIKRYDHSLLGIEEVAESGRSPAVGAISSNSDAVVGRNGYLYIYRGTNDTIGSYSRQADPLLVADWLTLLDLRKARLEGIGAAYFQLFIPEKATVIPAYFPFSIGDASPLWSALVRDACSGRNEVIDGDFVFKGMLASETAYRRHDSHLSTRGAFHLIRELIARAGKDPCAIKPANINRREIRGDLAGKFEIFPDMGPELTDTVGSFTWNGKEVGEPDLVHEHVAENGHQGLVRHWRNSFSPIDMRVICFGNSFFERGGASFTLSWWCARLFSEFRFVWSPTIDDDQVVQMGAQIVVGQTIERFLGRVPTH